MLTFEKNHSTYEITNEHTMEVIRGTCYSNFDDLVDEHEVEFCHLTGHITSPTSDVFFNDLQDIGGFEAV